MRAAYVFVLALSLSACASAPNTRYFSLQSTEAVESINSSEAISAVLVDAVHVPIQLDRRQIVLMPSNGQELQVLNDYQWASPLADEIQQGLSAELSQRLGVPSAEQGRAGDGLAYWRVNVNVQRFDSVYEQYARQDLSWRISPHAIPGARSQLCRISLQTQAGKGVEGLVQAHQSLQSEFVKVLAQQMSGAPVITKAPTINAVSCVG